MLPTLHTRLPLCVFVAFASLLLMPSMAAPKSREVNKRHIEMTAQAGDSNATAKADGKKIPPRADSMLSPPLVVEPGGDVPQGIAEIAARQQELEQALADIQSLVKKDPAAAEWRREMESLRNYCDTITHSIGELAKIVEKRDNTQAATDVVRQLEGTSSGLTERIKAVEAAASLADAAWQARFSKMEVDNRAAITALNERLAALESGAGSSMAATVKKLETRILEVARDQDEKREILGKQWDSTQSKIAAANDSRFGQMEQSAITMKQDIALISQSLQVNTTGLSDITQRVNEAARLAKMAQVNADNASTRVAATETSIKTIPAITEYLQQTWKAYSSLREVVLALQEAVKNNPTRDDFEVLSAHVRRLEVEDKEGVKTGGRR